jgi:hypothetical protein
VRTRAEPLKIARLTPYKGGNLGDVAIQEAAIDNIKQRYTDAILYMVALCLARTTSLHRLTSFRITPAAMSHFALVS